MHASASNTNPCSASMSHNTKPSSLTASNTNPCSASMSHNTKPSSLTASNTNPCSASMSHNTKPCSLTPSMSHNTKPCSLTPSNTKPRKRLIIKLSYPPGSRKRDSDSCGTDENKRRKVQDSVRPVVTCYWVDSNYRIKTTPLSLSQPNHDNVVENNKITKNHVSNTAMSQPKQVSKTARAEESSRLCSKSISMAKDSSRAEESSVKKPMECVKRRGCWLILKRMLVGRDGWDLKDPPTRAMVDKSKAIGLNEIERKLRLYATPDEFASHMRLVFSNAMQLYPPRNHIYQIAKKFSHNFEHRWKSLKDEWKLEDRKRRKAHKSRRLEDTKDRTANMF
ncbi:hypothetical protein RYX36_015078 [Vicia faba]